MGKFRNSKFLIGMYLCSAILLGQSSSIMAQENTAVSDSAVAARIAEIKKKNAPKNTKLGLRDRFAFRANMVDWVLITPSVGVQFDLSPWDYNKMTIGANIKWNPGVNQTFTPSLDYKMFDARLEFRRYFRESLTLKPGQKRMPKYWRAYYWGIYASYTDYTVFIRNGFTGDHFGLGGTMGWEIPMVNFKTGSLDLDLGISAGMIYGRSQKRVNTGSTYEAPKDWHLVPYPIISEIRVGFVYRFKSIKEKYNRSKH